MALLALLLCLAVAMFYEGALDPAFAIRKTLVFGLLGVAMVFVFTGVEQLVQSRLVGWLGLSDQVGGILTGGFVALSVEPLERRPTLLVDGLGARRREDARVGVAPVDLPRGA